VRVRYSCTSHVRSEMFKLRKIFLQGRFLCYFGPSCSVSLFGFAFRKTTWTKSFVSTFQVSLLFSFSRLQTSTFSMTSFYMASFILSSAPYNKVSMTHFYIGKFNFFICMGNFDNFFLWQVQLHLKANMPAFEQCTCYSVSVSSTYTCYKCINSKNWRYQSTFFSSVSSHFTSEVKFEIIILDDSSYIQPFGGACNQRDVIK
jgi:hypothetical protein